MIKGLMDLD